MNGYPVSGSVNLSNHVSGEAVYFTSPVGLAANGAVFTVDGTPVSSSDVFGVSTEAKVAVKSAVGSAAASTTGFATTSAQAASCGTADGGTHSLFPTATACATGSTASLVVTGPTSFSWSCISLTGGAEASCYATRGVTYTVTTSVSGSGGTISGIQQVTGGSSAVVTASPSGSNNTSWSGSCGGTPSGNSFTTNAVTQNCNVVASFSTAPAVVNGSCGGSNGGTFSATPTDLCSAGSASSVTTGTSTYSWSCASTNGGSTASCSATRTTTAPPPTGTASQVDTGYQSGLWVPPSNPNRTVADQSSSSMISSYVPGCLNGAYAKDSSSGCAGFDSFTGNTADTGVAHTVSLGSGKQLVLRYKTPSTLTNGKTIKVTGWNGGSVGVNMRIWLSTDALATYDNTSDICKSSGTVTPAITTGAVDSAVTTTYVFGKPKYTTTYYCKLDPNKVYYFGMEFNEAVSGLGGKFQVDELSADFLP
jgi:hypothetical protein